MTREEAIDIIKCLAWHTRPDEEDVEQAIKALEQEEPCEDWRDIPSSEMTIEQARQAVRELRKYVLDNYLLSDSGDAVSRKAVLEALRTMYDTHIIETEDGDEYIDYNDTVYEIEKLPPVTPQPKEMM